MKTPKELEDAVRQYQSGNTESFEQIYELSYRYLYTCVIHVVKNEEIAADMLQETYLEISRNLSQLKNIGDFLGWASTIGNRKCYTYLKKQRDMLVRSDDDQNGNTQDFFESIADDEAFIPETILQDREKRRLVQEIIDGLSDMQRLCIIGFYYRGQPIEEIAQELEIPANTVKSHLSRAKAKIKDAVIVLDRDKGTRLYSVAPFMLLLLSKEAEGCGAKPMPIALKKTLGGSGATNLGAGNSIAQKILQAGVRYKLAAGAVIPVKENGLWGAVNYENEEIVPCAYTYYKRDPNLAGYFVLAKDTENEEENAVYVYTLFAPDGTKVYEGTDYVHALGDFYVVRSTISSDKGYNNTAARLDYYDYDGKHVLSTDYFSPELWNAYVMGSCEGETPVRRQSLRQTDIPEIPFVADMEIGVLCADGTVRWNSGSGKWRSTGFDKGWVMGAVCWYPLGTPNHGYTIEGSWDGSDHEILHVCTEDHQYAFSLITFESEYLYLSWNDWQSFYHDGAFFRYYGSKAVWEINGTYLLVDLALPDITNRVIMVVGEGPMAYIDWETLLQVAEDHIPRGIVQAAYDYIGMDMNQYWLVQKGDQWGYIDHEGNEMAMYEDASQFANGYALIVEDGTAFLINEDFEIVEECGDADSVGCGGDLFYFAKDDDDQRTFFTYSR